jgi:hypothetical protein
VSDSIRVVSKVYFCAYAYGTLANDLTVELLASDGSTVLASGTISKTDYAGAVYSNPKWGSCNLNNTITLTVGSTYYLRISTTGGDSSNYYASWGISTSNTAYSLPASHNDEFYDGSFSGNGRLEYTVNGSTWLYYAYGDWMIYFKSQ